MKTLSIRQPWAELIVQGRKTLELRTWTIRYRGPLAIHASQTVERAACQALGLDPDQVTTGAVIGVVDLVAIEELDAVSYAARQGEHLADELFLTAVGAGLAPALGQPQGASSAEGQPQGHAPTIFGWRLAHPRALTEPVPMRGRMGLFEADVLGYESAVPSDGFRVDSPLTPQPETVRPETVKPETRPPAHPKPQNRPPETRNLSLRSFDLRVIPETDSGPGEATYRLALYQRSVAPPPDQGGLYEAEPRTMQRVAELGGATLRAVADQVLEMLRRNDYRPTDLSAGRREPFLIVEESGVRLALIFLAVKPVTKMARVEAISAGIRAMTSEELYYWYSKCTAGPVAERAQKALRVLLADE